MSQKVPNDNYRSARKGSAEARAAEARTKVARGSISTVTTPVSTIRQAPVALSLVEKSERPSITSYDGRGCEP